MLLHCISVVLLRSQIQVVLVAHRAAHSHLIGNRLHSGRRLRRVRMQRLGPSLRFQLEECISNAVVHVLVAWVVVSSNELPLVVVSSVLLAAIQIVLGLLMICVHRCFLAKN